jgi:hypothetical protein
VSKFLRNILVQISKALVNLKIQFYFERIFLSASGPVGPTAPPTCSAFWPSGLQPNPSSGEHAEPAHRLWIPFPSLLQPELTLAPPPPRCPIAPSVPPLSPTDAMEPQRPALPPPNSTPHQLNAITPPPPLESGNQHLQAEALKLSMKPRCMRPLRPPIKG